MDQEALNSTTDIKHNGITSYDKEMLWRSTDSPKNQNARKPKTYNGWEGEKEKYPMSAAEGQHRDYI